MNLLKQIKLLIALAFLFVPVNAQHKIFLLNGTSSAGKSSIARELAPLLSGPTEVVCMDQMTYEVARQIFFDKCGHTPCSDAELEAYFDHLFEKEPKERDLFNNEMGQQMYAKIRKLHMEGKNVIFDTCMDEKEEFEFCVKKLHDLPVVLVLVYCPLEILFQHLIQRNQLQDTNEHRDLDLPFSQFFNTYKKRETSAEVSVDILKRIQVEHIAEQLKTLAQQHEKREVELTKFLKGIDEQTPTICKKLGLDQHEEIEITPTLFKYDIIVNTGMMPPQGAAQDIKKSLEHHVQYTAMQKNYEQLQAH
jgi:chloramphenicol 3-O-phosphotransferase